MARRRKQRIDGQPERMFKHTRDNSAEQIRTQLKAGVGVDFNEPNMKVAVNHEIKTENLEIMGQVLRIHCQIASFKSI